LGWLIAAREVSPELEWMQSLIRRGPLGCAKALQGKYKVCDLLRPVRRYDNGTRPCQPYLRSAQPLYLGRSNGAVTVCLELLYFT